MSTILVIDDDPALHHLIEGAVAADGFRVQALLRRIALSEEFYRIEETHR